MKLSSSNQKKTELLDDTLADVQKKLTSDLSKTVLKKKEAIKNDAKQLPPANIEDAVVNMANL